LFVHKYDYELKIKILTEYQNGTYGFREICRIYGIAQSTLKNWIRLYKTFGSSGLKTNSTASRYPSELKEAAVQEYLAHQEPFKEILKKYQIRSETQLRRWIKKYNGHEELKTSGTGGSVPMTKGRKTSLDERVEIVQYCIANDHNYTKTAQKYKVSYQQARNYTLKYETGGVDALQDRRGRTKPVSEMTEVEKLRAENRILKAEKKHAEMEANFLKKLNEIERRRG
jgi:transposase-like protein